MPGDRLLRILDLLSAADIDSGTARICQVAADAVVMTGAGIMLMTGDAPRGSICTTDSVSALIEDLQYTLGEGPCVDAHGHDRPVLEPDLANPAVSRWPAFSPSALEAGARAVFGFPLQVGGIRLGALNLYRDQPGALTDDQHADALAMAGVAARAVIAMQAQAPPGALAAELEAGANFQFVVHQATGMVAAQLEVSVGEALIRLRAHAFATNQVLAEVATQVVARELRFNGGTT